MIKKNKKMEHENFLQRVVYYGKEIVHITNKHKKALGIELLKTNTLSLFFENYYKFCEEKYGYKKGCHLVHKKHFDRKHSAWMGIDISYSTVNRMKKLNNSPVLKKWALCDDGGIVVSPHIIDAYKDGMTYEDCQSKVRAKQNRNDDDSMEQIIAEKDLRIAEKDERIAFQNFKECHTSFLNAKQIFKNTQQNIYQTLTKSENGDSSIINSIFTDFLEFSNQTDKDTFQIPLKIYDEWKEKRFGLNFKLSFEQFRCVYKPLYQYPKLHFLASRGFIRAKHIRQWSKIEPHLPQDLNEIQSADDIKNLLKRQEDADNDGEENNMEQIIAEKDERIAELEERLHQTLSPILPPYQRQRKANKSGYIYIISLPCSSWKDDKGNQLFKLGETEEEDEKKVYEYFKNKYMTPTVGPDVELLIKVENPHNLEQQILTIMQQEQCIFNAVNTTTSEFFSEKNLLKVLDIIKKRENSVWEYKKDMFLLMYK